jgi:hypothetical protein
MKIGMTGGSYKAALGFLIVFCGAAFADGGKLHAGLWEVTITRQLRNGQDLTAKRAAVLDKMRAAMEKMSPEQRQKMEAMLATQGVSMSGAAASRVCISAAMAARDTPFINSQSQCESAKLTRSGNSATVEFSCTRDGRTTTGTGRTSVDGDSALVSVDMTTTDASGPLRIQIDSTLKFVGSDCQGVQPIDELFKGGQEPAH